MGKKSEIFLEEAVLDDLAEGYNSLELPLSQKVFKLIGAAVFLYYWSLPRDLFI